MMIESAPDFKPEPDLRLTEAQLAMQQQLMELTGVAQTVLHLKSQQFSVNARALEMFGLATQTTAVTMDDVEALIHPNDLAQFYRAGERSRDVEGTVEVDFRVQRPDGRLVYLHARRFTERDAKGRAVANVMLALDITERKRVENNLLETAERFRALTALSSDGHWDTSSLYAMTAPAPLTADGGAVAASKSPTTPRRKMRVLYVEDNMFNLMLFDEIMQTRDDVELRIAQDGAKGFEVASTWYPDVLVLDANLPDIHGFELLDQMRRVPELLETPAFICSGDTMPEHKQAAQEAGFQGYWTKPVDIDRIFSDLDAIADRRFDPVPVSYQWSDNER